MQQLLALSAFFAGLKILDAAEFLGIYAVLGKTAAAVYLQPAWLVACVVGDGGGVYHTEN